MKESESNNRKEYLKCSSGSVKQALVQFFFTGEGSKEFPIPQRENF